jgi:hypothetical protein
VPPDPGNPVKYETKVYPIGRIVDYPFIMSGERYEANDSSSFIYQPHRHGEDEDEDGDGVESHANVSHSQRSQPATQIPRKHRPPARRGKGTAQTTGEQAQRVRALSAEPQISPTGYRYFEPMMASPEALAEVNLRSNAQDVILQNLQRGDAEIMRKQGEEPPRILQLPGKSSAARAAMAAGEAANGEAAAPPASAPPDSAMPASSFASAAPSAPASSMPETPTPAPDTTPGPAVAAKRRKKTRTETQAGEKAAHEAQEAERARNRLIENAAGRYAFKKTGAWVGYDEFYTHQQKAIAHQNKLDQAAAAAKAGRQAQAEPAK